MTLEEVNIRIQETQIARLVLIIESQLFSAEYCPKNMYWRSVPHCPFPIVVTDPSDSPGTYYWRQLRPAGVREYGAAS
jgi:hypothetical protein